MEADNDTRLLERIRILDRWGTAVVILVIVGAAFDLLPVAIIFALVLASFLAGVLRTLILFRFKSLPAHLAVQRFLGVLVLVPLTLMILAAAVIYVGIWVSGNSI